MLLDLQRYFHSVGQHLDRRIIDYVADGNALAGAGLEQPPDVGKLGPDHALGLEDCGLEVDLLDGRPAQVVAQLGMPDQHDRQHAAVGRGLHQPLQADQRLDVRVVRLVDEQSHRFAAPSDVLLEHALPRLAPCLGLESSDPCPPRDRGKER
ncbi:hypothetical protein [Arenibaculum pallidiluteum]|uniref:hypothetical protein n=1 Tax=Arenibaculum pallidiluteum TaxID=2812559 RepID=UPI001A9699BA